MAAARYGWTLDYILWGISWVNLQWMLNDKMETLYKFYESKSGSDDSITETSSSDYIQVDEDTTISEISGLFKKKK